MRRLIVGAVLIGLMLLHFRAMLFVSWHEWIWGISISADPVGVISEAYSRYIQALNGCASVHSYGSFPFGAENPGYFRVFLEPQWILMSGLITLLTSPFVAYNAAVLLTFVINFVVIFWVTGRWLDNWFVALVPATLVTFSVYSFAHSYAHLGLLLVCGVPLFYVLLADFLRNPTSKLAVGVALVAALNLYASPYYFYFVFCMGVVMSVHHIALSRGLSRQLVMHGGIMIAVLVLAIMPFVYDQLIVDYSTYWTSAEVGRSFGDDIKIMNAYSARPSDYLFSNVHHAFLGGFYSGLVADLSAHRSLYSDELPVSLGICTVVFLVYLLATWLKGKTVSGNQNQVWLPGQQVIENHAVIVPALLVMLVAFLFSLAPRFDVAGVELYTPNELLRHIVPFRSYSRFAIVVLSVAAILMALTIDRSRKPVAWTTLVILIASLDTLSGFYLHATHADRDYIRYLRERPENTMMRFEAQNVTSRRRLDLDAILTGKQVPNGLVNLHFGTTDWLVNRRPEGFTAGNLADMGVELLVVEGEIGFPLVDQPYVELLKAFPEKELQIWKIRPSGNKVAMTLFENAIRDRTADNCRVMPKAEVQLLMKSFVESLPAG